MKNIVNIVPIILIYILSFSLPLVFTPFTTEYFETAKLILLGATVIILLILWGIKIFVQGKIVIVKTPLDLLFLLFLLVAILSTVFSPTPYPALFGLLPKIHGSLIFIITVVLLYFMVVSNLKTRKHVEIILQLMLLSGIILATTSLVAYFKLFLPWKAAQIVSFSFAGSSLSTAIYVTMLLPLSLSLLFAKRRFEALTSSDILGILSSAIFLVTIVLLGNLSVWIGSIISILLVLIYFKPVKNDYRLFSTFGVVGIIVLLVAIFSYTPTLKEKTILGKYASSFPREIQLPFAESWKISVGAFRDSPILGTGPATYLYDFTQYKPLEVNSSSFWNLRLSSANNQYLQTLAELGGTGLILIGLIAISFVFLSLRSIKDEDPLIKGLALTGISFIVLMALVPMSTLTQGAGFLALALFMVAMIDHQSFVKQMEIHLTSGQETHPLIPTIVFIPILALSIAGVYFLGKLYLGEFYHKKAADAIAAGKILDGYNFLVSAEKINPQVDLYRSELAQTNFGVANAIAAQKGPTEASPGGSLTTQDKTNIQQFLKQAIGEGGSATVLAPRSAANFEILAQIYRQISGVAQNAIQFSLNYYGKAIKLDPFNPLLRIAVGEVYYQSKNYDLAVRFFDDAVALKPDLTIALYNLALALRDKGNTADAISIAEKLVANLQDQVDSSDYQTASKLLSDLKEKQSTQKPEASSSAALQKSNLPNVDLGKPEQNSTPPAVKK